MDSNRRAAIVTGVLFIVATAASLVSAALEQPVGTGAGYLLRSAQNADRLSAGVLMELIAAGTSVAIAISLYPILRRWGSTLALGSVVFRSIEAVGYTVGAVSLLTVLTVGQQYAVGGTADRAWLQAIADSFVSLRQAAVLAGVFAFGVGGTLYYAIFYRSRLIPRWLSGWGIVAEGFALVACVGALFSRNAITSYAILMLPIAVQEMVLAVWLIARGFDAGVLSEASSEAAPQPADYLPLARAGRPSL